MKIVVPIYRFNWYRTLAPVVDEALRRGYDVECWHNESSANFSSNRPSAEKMPRFSHGSPSVSTYESEDELQDKVLRCDADAIVSIDLPLDAWLEQPGWNKRKFKYLTIATTDTLRRLLDKRMMDSTDLISVRSERELQSCIQDHTTDYKPWIEFAVAQGKDGARFINLVQPRIGKEWDEELIGEFRKKAVVCGYPFLDAFKQICPDEVRARWNIEPQQKVVGFWSTPTQGRGYHGDWDCLFAEKNRFRFRYRAMRAYGLKGWGIPFCNEEQILRAVHHFAFNNDAVLVTKLRHYQQPGESLYSRFTDRVVGEDGYYPHTAFELAAISDLMIGFHTTGMTEAVFAGSPVLNLVIPGFPHDLHMNTIHFFDGMYDHPGVVYRRQVREAVSQLPTQKLADFPLVQEQAKSYKNDFCGPDADSFSARLLNEFEKRRA